MCSRPSSELRDTFIAAPPFERKVVKRGKEGSKGNDEEGNAE